MEQSFRTRDLFLQNMNLLLLVEGFIFLLTFLNVPINLTITMGLFLAEVDFPRPPMGNPFLPAIRPSYEVSYVLLV
jgi:hypothetical protein